MISRTLWALLIAGLMLGFGSYPMVVAGDDDDDNDKPESTKDRGNSESRKAGRFVQSGATHYEGRYVDFGFDPATCRISNYSVYNQTVLQAIQLPTPCEAKGRSEDQQPGSSFQVGSDDVSIRIHDAPNGLVRIQAEDDQSVHLEPASGSTFTPNEDGAEFKIGELTGLLRLEESDDPWNVTDKARLWVHPLAAGAERAEIGQAIKSKKVAAEVDVLLENGSISNEIFTYEDVIMKASRTANGSFRFLVDANLTEGRTFVINVGPGLFKHGQVGLQYWDLDETSQEHQVAITLADGLADVLEIADGEGPEYWITDDADGKHVLVAVPHFSAHVFEIASVPAEVVPIVLWGFVGGIAFVSLGAVGMFRRRSA